MAKLFAFAVLLAVAAYAAADASLDIETNEIEGKVDSSVDRSRLIIDLLKKYDKRSYISNNTLKFGLSLTRFDVDEANNNINADLWMKEEWTDTRLRWDPQQYGGETVLRLPANQVWLPDLALYNSATQQATPCRETNVLVYSTGQVLWVPPCQVKAYCNLTLDELPFGEQQCSLKFGSWTYDGFLLDLQFYNNEEQADVKDLWNTSDYEITGNTAVRVNKKYDCCVEPYPYISFDLTFQRKKNTHAKRCRGQ